MIPHRLVRVKKKAPAVSHEGSPDLDNLETTSTGHRCQGFVLCSHAQTRPEATPGSTSESGVRS